MARNVQDVFQGIADPGETFRTELISLLALCSNMYIIYLYSPTDQLNYWILSNGTSYLTLSISWMYCCSSQPTTARSFLSSCCSSIAGTHPPKNLVTNIPPLEERARFGQNRSRPGQKKKLCWKRTENHRGGEKKWVEDETSEGHAT